MVTAHEVVIATKTQMKYCSQGYLAYKTL